MVCCAEAIEDASAGADRVVELENALYQTVNQEGAEEEGVLADKSNAQRFKMQRLGGSMKFAQNALFEPRALVEAVDVTSAPHVVTPPNGKLQGEQVTGFHRLSMTEIQTVNTEDRIVWVADRMCMKRAAKAALQTVWQSCADALSGQRGTPPAEATELPSPANGLRLRNWNHAYDDDAAAAGDAEHSQQHDRLWRDSNPMFEDVCPLVVSPRPGADPARELYCHSQ